MTAIFNKIKNWALVVLFMAALTSSFVLKKTIQEKNRLNSNQTALLENIAFFKTSDSLNAASVQKLTLEKDEFRQYNEELSKTIENLNIKLKRVKAASVTATVSEYKPETIIKDSIVYRDRQAPDTLKCLEYTDAWIDIRGCFKMTDTLFTPQINTRDTINQVIDRVPRKFLFIRYGTKAIRQTIVMSNPYSNPVYTKYIELKH